LEIRIADFKGCVLLPLLLLLFEKPSAAGQDPEITFVNSFRGSLEMCTNRRPFKTAKVKTFSTFHVVVTWLKPQAHCPAGSPLPGKTKAGRSETRTVTR
jgi:hypothetical protein